MAPSQDSIAHIAREDHQTHEDDQHALLAIRLTVDSFLHMVLKSVVELNILEIMAEVGEGTLLSVTDISAKLPTENPDTPIVLDRMLALLASHSVIRSSARTGEDGQVQRLYGIGPVSKYFLKNRGAGSVGPLLLLDQDKVFMESWYYLNDAILQGGIAFDRAFKKSLFELSGTDGRFNQVFNQGMANFTTLIVKNILDVYKGFHDVEVLVDVGGNLGANLNQIITKYPHIKGINYDLPHVIATAASYSGIEHVGGNMFESVPQGDAILIKSILHDWNDDDCLKILKNCCTALPKSGKVILLELIRPEVPESTDTAKLVYSVDVLMFGLLGGKERTQKEFETLAKNSGFSSCAVICSGYYFSVIELRK